MNKINVIFIYNSNLTELQRRVSYNKIVILKKKESDSLTNIAIVGGGIVGSTTAFFLAQQANVNITIFDDGIGQATKAAAGIISPWLSKRRNKRWYHLANLGAGLYPQLKMDAHLSHDAYQQTGTLITRSKQTDLDELVALAVKRKQDAPQMQTIDVWQTTEIKRALPFISSQMQGVFVSGGARVDGHALIRDLLNTAKLHVNKQRVQLSQKERQLFVNGQAFDMIVLASGAWLNQLIHPLGLTSVVTAQKGQLIELTVPNLPVTEKMPVVMPEGQRDIIPTGDHRLLIGATHENELGFDLQKDDHLLQSDLLASAQLNIDHLKWSQVDHIRVGTRAYTPDFAPFFGRLPQSPNILVASGLGSSGLTTGPLIGQLMAEAIIKDHNDFSQFSLPVSDYVMPD